MSHPSPSRIRLRLLGTVPYEEALTRMRQWTAARHEAHKATRAAPPPPLTSPKEAATTCPEPAGSPHPARYALPNVVRGWADPADAPRLGDEIWLLQHPPVFTLGLNARTEHLHDAGDIPVIPTERGGQITYHGPGQIMAYLMLDLRHRKLGIRPLVDRVEEAIITCLAGYGIEAIRQDGAPGIYVRLNPPLSPPEPGQQDSRGLPIDRAHASNPRASPTSPVSPTDIPSPTTGRRQKAVPAADVAKIASIGLKATHGFSYHGLALNGQMDLNPFLRINPCGFQNLAMTDVFHETGKRADIDLEVLALNLGRALQAAIEGSEG
ncbi:MAG: lipoyl(octanoyl) transferase LipB [Lautropia sp.]|nr:lipoyl(octanoyl) transferase LipB [Lautropia sp.]